jgi:predicted nucleic acid-binding protein
MSYVLADTSVWVDLLRRGESSWAEELASLLKKKLVCTHGVVKAELLSGAGSEREYQALEKDLAVLPLLEDPPELW